MFGYVAKDKRDNSYFDNGKFGTSTGIKKQYIWNDKGISYSDALKIKSDKNGSAIVYIVHECGKNFREIFYSENNFEKISVDELSLLHPFEIKRVPYIKKICLIDTTNSKKTIVSQKNKYSLKIEIAAILLWLIPFTYAFFQARSWLFIEICTPITLSVFTVFGITHGSDELLYLLGHSKNQRYVRMKYIIMILVLPLSIFIFASLDWNKGYNSRVLTNILFLMLFNIILYYLMWKQYRRLFK